MHGGTASGGGAGGGGSQVKDPLEVSSGYIGRLMSVPISKRCLPYMQNPQNKSSFLRFKYMIMDYLV
jgi:hypothetical protein